MTSPSTAPLVKMESLHKSYGTHIKVLQGKAVLLALGIFKVIEDLDEAAIGTSLLQTWFDGVSQAIFGSDE